METTDNEVWRGVAHHMRQIASYGVRNQGSLAGNLMMKHYHNDFPSDVFLSLETAGAQLEIMDHLGVMETVPLNTLPTMNMDRKLIVRIKITLQAMKDQIGNRKREISHLWMSRNSFMKTADAGEWVYRSFKIMPRSSNAHAYVNAGFLAFVDKPNSKLLNRPRIVFGGISSTFIHASATESFLEGRELTQDIFLEALGILAEELILDEEPGLASPVYRKQLALSLFYKVIKYHINTHIQIQFLKNEILNKLGNFFLGAISLRMIGVPSPKIVLNFRTYMKLNCRREPVQWSLRSFRTDTDPVTSL